MDGRCDCLEAAGTNRMAALRSAGTAGRWPVQSGREAAGGSGRREDDVRGSSAFSGTPNSRWNRPAEGDGRLQFSAGRSSQRVGGQFGSSFEGARRQEGAEEGGRRLGTTSDGWRRSGAANNALQRGVAAAFSAQRTVEGCRTLLAFAKGCRAVQQRRGRWGGSEGGLGRCSAGCRRQGRENDALRRLGQPRDCPAKKVAGWNQPVFWPAFLAAGGLDGCWAEHRGRGGCRGSGTSTGGPAGGRQPGRGVRRPAGCWAGGWYSRRCSGFPAGRRAVQVARWPGKEAGDAGKIAGGLPETSGQQGRRETAGGLLPSRAAARW